jgi:UDP-glucose 4-epimerase
LPRSVLVTGGAGYLGTHILVALAAAGRHCVSVDNHSNSSPAAIDGVLALAPGAVTAYEVDVRDAQALRVVLGRHQIDGVVHLAGLKSVAESIRDPGLYQDNNVQGTRTLLDALEATDVRNIVFSSSATVYGPGAPIPYLEGATTAPANPYGETKLAAERILAERARHGRWRVANLRYFNPVGAHPSARIGESPRGTPNNLMPYVCQVAAGWRDHLSIFGNDYATRDGTGVRDYIHVMDLAEGHIAALNALESAPTGTVMTLNLGTGRGFSVLEVLAAFEKVNGVSVPREFAPRRDGDIAEYFADPSRARQTLAWTARLDLQDMCRDAWRWQQTLRKP